MLLAKLKAFWLWLGYTLGILESLQWPCPESFLPSSSEQGDSSCEDLQFCLLICKPPLTTTFAKGDRCAWFITVIEGANHRGMPGTELEKLVYISQKFHKNLHFHQGAPTCSHGKHTGSGILKYFGLKAQVSPLTLHLKFSKCLFSQFSKWGIIHLTQVVIGCD